MKLRTLIVDDEAPARSELRFLLEGFPEIEVIGESASAGEALKLIKALNHDVVFLDIQMPETTGLEMSAFLHDLEKPPLIVFVTAYSEHAVKAFELDAIDYLVKPINEDRLAQTVLKLTKAVSKRIRTVNQPDSTGRLDKIPVEKHGKTILLSIDDIFFVNIKHDYVYINTFEESYLTSFTMAKLEERLAERSFFRTHRGFLVNLHKVKEIVPMFKGNYILKVKDKDISEIPVSRRQARKLKAYLGM